MASSVSAAEIDQVLLVLGDEFPVPLITQALLLAEKNIALAINMILDDPSRFQTPPSDHLPVSAMQGVTVSVASVASEMGFIQKDVPLGMVKEEAFDLVVDPAVSSFVTVKKGADTGCFVKDKPMYDVKEDIPHLGTVKETDMCSFVKDESVNNAKDEIPGLGIVKEEKRAVKEEKPDVGVVKEEKPDIGVVKEEKPYLAAVKKEIVNIDDDIPDDLTQIHYSPYLNPRPITCIRPKNVVDVKKQVYKPPVGIVEDGDFPHDPEWLLVGRTNITSLSTSRGIGKLVCNEIVHFNFPKPSQKAKFGRQWVSSRTKVAVSEIVRFETKRSGEIGRLPTEWSRCIIPLVNSSKVMVRGRCVFAPNNLCLLQEIVLYVSFYIHSSIFSEGESSWRLTSSCNVDSTVQPLPTLFKLLKINKFQKAEFTPEELDSRKRSLNLEVDDQDALPLPSLAKKRKSNQMYTKQTKDEQAVTEASLNKLVGTADVYDIKEAEPPSTLLCVLRPYQKQALHWMTELENGVDVEQAAKTLHPCWDAYHIADKKASAVYVNAFSGEATTKFPSALQMARGGILADAMGLGKTVMTISLILKKPRGNPEVDRIQIVNKKNKQNGNTATPKYRGGTLIVCPMALLGQWKDELETHSESGSLSVFVHYGGDRTHDPQYIAEPDVVLTTYGILGTAYSNSAQSIFHKVEWHRVVLDEAHTIKSSKCKVSQSAFALTSHCRWCLTGTPLQNNLEDLYSLLCFLHVEPWCNWIWWSKLIQKPYENGDERGLKLIKAILRPLMLRRTKETKDKEGRPILVLPPAEIEILECDQSEAERDFYVALFKKSKVKFNQFLAQGKVLHNYASILELLLRLRQCCNHPFLVLSRGSSDLNLNKLAQNFAGIAAPAYVDEVIDEIRRGEVSECPICLESASDDPVITPCMHRMCRECLLSSWRSSSDGPCPICRKHLTKTELMVCPSESQFWVDVEGNWKESSKITRLMECLEKLRLAGKGEKSIIFSQWTSFMDLLEIPLKKQGFDCLRFDGKLSQKRREIVLKEFNENPRKTILLMSLRAGGVGLNLTAASNVFMMDPWWNPAVEEQAIMRIHRIGQKRQVRVSRFIVKDTVEERMQQVQARKQRMISGALTDDEVRSARIEELKMLFR